MKDRSDIGIIGLGAMGSAIARNFESKGYTVSVFNRSGEKTAAFLEQFGEGNFRGADSPEEFCAQLESPRKILLMVKAGDAVDETLQLLMPHLAAGDVVIDGGNSHYKDTERRVKTMESAGLLFVGCGISGGEEGALKGPSMMPGGSEAAKDLVLPMLLDVCARTEIGEACCMWMGPGGAGHFVKMVHNGIEYGEMEVLCEIYDIMHTYAGMDTAMCGRTFDRWARRDPGYLTELAGKVLQKQDADGSLLADHILDAAGQKGTGAWSVIACMELGLPSSVLSEAVNARLLSAAKSERVKAADMYGAGGYRGTVISAEERFSCLQMLQEALQIARILCYAQGFALLKAASDTYGWTLNLGEIAQIWRAGCIIRSALLDDIKQAFVYDRDLNNLLFSNLFHAKITENVDALRKTCGIALQNGFYTPGLTAAMNYFNGMTSAELPANLLQGMRDAFGAHTYERKDAPRGEFFHSEW